MALDGEVARFAVASRAGVSLLAALSALLVAPYDTSAQSSALDGGAQAPLAAAFANWDGVYFTGIARRGYEYEHFHAFFPLYPLLVRLVSLGLPLSPSNAILVAGWLVSNLSFVGAAVALYRLGLLVLRDERVARRAAYLFCIAPSSIFMSAIYSESLMCLFSFAGMYFLEKDIATKAISTRFLTRNMVLSAILFGFASATRSNGILLSLYIAWHRLRASPSPLSELNRFVVFWFSTALLGVIAIGPQVAYFVAAMTRYCPSLFAPNGSETPNDRSWCRDVVPNFSAMYMFIQKEYWNVGLLRYYEWKQLPNFLLASPVIVLSIHSITAYFGKHGKKNPAGESVAVYYLHWLFLLVNALLVVHIQVTTRLLAACPPLFWHPAATICQSNTTRYCKTVVGYFLMFIALGGVLFPTFYPWT